MIKRFNSFINESFSDTKAEISMILMAIENIVPEFIDQEDWIISNSHREEMLVYDLKTDKFDKEEMTSANKRLKNINYEIILAGRDYVTNTWHVLIVESDFYKDLKSKDILFYKDLEWKDWNMGKVLNVKTTFTWLDLKNGSRLSIINGKRSKMDIRKEFEMAVNSEPVASLYNSCEVCIKMIEIQLNNLT